MKIKSKIYISVIVIMDAIVVVIIVLLILNGSNTFKDSIDNPTLHKAGGNRYTTNMTVPIINRNSEIASAQGRLQAYNVIQQVLENTIKTNDEIALMAVYSDDGTIFAHFKPERIGKNMYDVDVELDDCMRDMFKAMKNGKIYNGLKYDPLLNDNIRFIVKPLQIGNLDHNLSLLIGIPESYLLH